MSLGKALVGIFGFDYVSKHKKRKREKELELLQIEQEKIKLEMMKKALEENSNNSKEKIEQDDQIEKQNDETSITLKNK